MILKQIRSNDGTGTLTYLLGDETTMNAAVIDPNIEDTDRIIAAADELGLTITHILDTHTHADHVTGAGELRNRLGATVVMHENTKTKRSAVESGVGEAFGITDILTANVDVPVDRYVQDGDIVEVGDMKIEALYTPGHTDNHITWKVGNNLFTGDLLLAGQAGRSDLPGGNTESQYRSLQEKIVGLPADTRIYPGHDYDDTEFVLLGDELKSNPFLAPMSQEEYVALVHEFFPPITESLGHGKVTLQCGTARVFHDAPFRNISPAELSRKMTDDPSLFLLDVREPFELQVFGAIPGVVNIPAGEVRGRMADLPSKETPLTVVCQSGGRSQEIADYLSKQGFKEVYNLQGGTMGWLNSQRTAVA